MGERFRTIVATVQSDVALLMVAFGVAKAMQGSADRSPSAARLDLRFASGGSGVHRRCGDDCGDKAGRDVVDVARDGDCVGQNGG
jgi:hypothetical protein